MQDSDMGIHMWMANNIPCHVKVSSVCVCKMPPDIMWNYLFICWKGDNRVVALAFEAVIPDFSSVGKIYWCKVHFSSVTKFCSLKFVIWLASILELRCYCSFI